MPSTMLRWMLICMLALLLSAVVHAEGNCPPGQYPIGTPQGQIGQQGCAPIPGYNQQQAQPQLPAAIWLPRWGAIAVDPNLGIMGAKTLLPSENQAEQAALALCAAKGGQACKIQVSYANQCAVIAQGDKRFNAALGDTPDDATRAGLRVCRKADTHCQIVYSDCSPPLRIQ